MQVEVQTCRLGALTDFSHVTQERNTRANLPCDELTCLKALPVAWHYAGVGGAKTHGVDRRENNLQLAQTVLVIVPDRELQRSIAFALEAEGLQLEFHDSLAGAIAQDRLGAASCVVVDEDALDARREALAQIGHATKPLILLVDRLHARSDIEGVTVLTKPLLGRLLVETVESFVPLRPEVAQIRSFP